MKRFAISVLLLILALSVNAQTWVRVNQVGYLPKDVKVAVLISTQENVGGDFQVFNAVNDQLVMKGTGKVADPSKWALKSAYRLDFSQIQEEGGYYIVCGGAKSPVFKISADAYDGLADYLLNYMRQQRCGYNPYIDAECHHKDGYIVGHPTRDGEFIDVTGGWHDAADYLQYMTTSSTTIYQMAFAYKYTKDKSIFKDEYDALGKKGANGIPDILDEVKWGLDWLDKMNPAPKEMYYQIGDDRDHCGMRYPSNDPANYGYGPGEGRCVYFVSGMPQQRKKGVNRTTGVSSAAGKFASTFALGADVIGEYYPDFAKKIQGKVQSAYDFALEIPGNTQTACVVSPYFYEEDTWVDDVELAAATMYSITGEDKWKKEASYWGEQEPINPWMERGRGVGKFYHHYQWYPFINLGHFLLASSDDSKVSSEFADYMREGLECLKKRAGNEPFMHGVPYLWCSNNLTSSAATHAHLYALATGDNQYREMEAALRDWLLGCNPWGTTMISGVPFAEMPGYDYPVAPHSSYTYLDKVPTWGGLIDGPIYNVLFQERAGGVIEPKDDVMAALNNGIAVYHDIMGDYASNEPTMDGTAGLAYIFAAQEQMGRDQKKEVEVKDQYGAIVRLNPASKTIRFVFTSDGNMNGADFILKVLKEKGIKGSFFVTGNHLRNPKLKKITERLIKEGHYLGGHSDKHALYADWGADRKSLMTPEQIIADLKANYAELAKFGITLEKAPYFLPGYEHYNKASVDVLNSLGLKVVNYTPGTGTPADYTTINMPSFKSAQQLIDGLYAYEEKYGLDGAIIMFHPGIHPDRPESEHLYRRIGEIIDYLAAKGYNFDRF